jgi:YHS domain-containing protein
MVCLEKGEAVTAKIIDLGLAKAVSEERSQTAISTPSSPVRASDKPTADPAENPAGSEPNVPTQNASPAEAKGTTTAKVNVDIQGIILKGYDVVAYFKQGKPVKGNSAIESTYQGATYLFASSADKADFDKDPAKYAPRYGAFCAYGVANGVLADPDLGEESAFVVYKGKLYVCGDEGALKEFKSDIDSNIEKADTNWRQLAGS